MLENVGITQQNIVYLIVTCALLLALPIIVTSYWKAKCGEKVKISSFFIGAVGFLVTVRVLEMIPHIFCILLDNPVSRFINGNVWAYALYGITMAGVFEEVGRYVIMKYIWKKNQTKENVIMYGIGHGGIEVYAISFVAIVSYLVIAIMILNNGLAMSLVILGVTDPASKEAFSTVIEPIAHFGFGSMVASVLERIAAMTLHISLSIVVYYGIKVNQKKYLALAIIAHAVFDLFPALYQKATVSMLTCQIWIYCWAVAAVVYAYRLYQKLQDPIVIEEN